jgi:ABC-2 type transport system ATP-binding protein
MRAELCGSLLHRPGLLFLDEPSIGLDAVSKLALRDFLKWENREHGTTVLLTTHDMEDVAALCSRVMVLGHGKKLYDGDLPTLLSRYDTVRTVTVRFEQPDILPELPGAAGISREGDLVRVEYSPQVIPTPDILQGLQQAGTIRELTIQPENIDYLIASMYREMEL